MRLELSIEQHRWEFVERERDTELGFSVCSVIPKCCGEICELNGNFMVTAERQISLFNIFNISNKLYTIQNSIYFSKSNYL